jgi:hypothetical protein
MRWIDRSGSDASGKDRDLFWTQHRADLAAGTFWDDRIKQLRDDPAGRLELAVDNLPLPTAFDATAKALRSIIREHKKENRPVDSALKRLYELAVVESFGIPYSTVLQEPGYNVLESVPGSDLFLLPFNYEEIGYDKLWLLSATDRKLLVANWRQPRQHTTLHDAFLSLWQKYESELKERRIREGR